MKSQTSSRRTTLIIVSPLVATALIACGDDTVTPIPPATVGTGGSDVTTTTTTSSVGGMGGTGGTPTTSVGGGGMGGMGGMGGEGGQGGEPLDLCMGPDTGTDTCDGETIALSPGDNLELCGDLTNAANDYAGAFCPGAGTGGDTVYNLSFTQAGSLRVQVRREDGSDLNPTLYARAPGACTSSDTFDTFGCWDFFSSDSEEFVADIDPNDPGGFPIDAFHLFVDAAPDENAQQTTGGYHLDISFEAASCGDGVWNNDFTANPTAPRDEECDDGNNVDGDGCSSTCTIEPSNLFDDCANPNPFFLASNQQITITNNSVGFSDNVTPDMSLPNDDCEPTTPVGLNEAGQDLVYNVTPMTAGTITARIGLGPNCQVDVCENLGAWDPGCWDYTLYAIDGSCVDNTDNNFCDPFAPNPDDACPAGSTCTDNFVCTNVSFPNTQLACSDSKVLGPEEISFPVTGMQSYTVVVDGHGPFAYGAFNLCLEHTP